MWQVGGGISSLHKQTHRCYYFHLPHHRHPLSHILIRVDHSKGTVSQGTEKPQLISLENFSRLCTLLLIHFPAFCTTLHWRAAPCLWTNTTQPVRKEGRAGEMIFLHLDPLHSSRDCLKVGGLVVIDQAEWSRMGLWCRVGGIGELLKECW